MRAIIERADRALYAAKRAGPRPRRGRLRWRRRARAATAGARRRSRSGDADRRSTWTSDATRRGRRHASPELGEVVTLDPDQPPYETRPRFSRGDDVPSCATTSWRASSSRSATCSSCKRRDALQDRRVPAGGRLDPAQLRSTWRRPTGPARRRGSRASARPSTRSWPSWRTPAACASTSGCGATCRPRWCRCWPCPASGRARPATCGAPGDRHARRPRGGRHARDACARCAASARRPSRRSSTGSPSCEKRPPKRMRLGEAEEVIERIDAGAGAAPGRPRGRCGRARSGACARPSATWTCWSRRTSRKPSSRAVHASAAVDRVGGHGGRLGTQRTTVQLLRGPQLDVMTMPAGAARARTWSTSRARRSTTCGCGSWPGTAAGASPSTASCASARTARRSSGEAAERRTFATEAEVYAFLGLPWIAPGAARGSR